MICPGKGEYQFIRAEKLVLLSVSSVYRVVSVFSVAKQRMANMGKMRADLMRPSGQKLDLSKRIFFAVGQGFIFCQNGARIRLWRIKNADKAFVRTAQQKGFQRCFLWGKDAGDNTARAP